MSLACVKSMLAYRVWYITLSEFSEYKWVLLMQRVKLVQPTLPVFLAANNREVSWMKSDKCRVMRDEGWCVMCEQWWVMICDEWWVTVDEWQLSVECWRMIDNGWYVTSDERYLVYIVRLVCLSLQVLRHHPLYRVVWRRAGSLEQCVEGIKVTVT